MTSTLDRIEAALSEALLVPCGSPCPPRLAAAMHHAVFPSGKRIRPRLVLAVAQACRCDAPQLAMAGAAAIELLHCASLVHDDLPCFDDADTRRGQPSVHAAFGEQIAVLTGDALIVLAFDVLARAAGNEAVRAIRMTAAIAAAVGAPDGIAAGQAWEGERVIDLDAYHRTKTGALFAGAAIVGALASGAAAEPWRDFGLQLGLAFQAADDLSDVLGDPEALGKPVGRDAALARPSAVRAGGVGAAVARVHDLLGRAVAAVPEHSGRDEFRAEVLREASRLMPTGLMQAAE